MSDSVTVVKRAIVIVWGITVIACGAIAVTACIRAAFVHDDPPLMIAGVLGGLMGIIAGFYLVRTGLRAGTFSRRTL